MSKVVLPRLNQTGANEWADVESNDVALREVVNGGIDNENIAKAAGITREKLASDAKGVQGAWYSPKVIATEENTSSTTFTTLTTADEVSGVVVPAGGLLLVRYTALVKSSASAGEVALFLGSEQVSGGNGVKSYSISNASFISLYTSGTTENLVKGGTTLSTLPSLTAVLPLAIAPPAGTYTVSVRYKASSGTVTAKERTLHATVLGF